jgi:hypothetical protein
MMEFKKRSNPIFKMGLILILSGLMMSSCRSLLIQMGLKQVPDLELRAGLMGTQAHPALLNPFKTYSMVLAAQDYRFFKVKFPAHWYWKVFVTVVNQKKRRGELWIRIFPSRTHWGILIPLRSENEFEVSQEGTQGSVGVINRGRTKTAYLELKQSGAPLQVLLQSEMAPETALFKNLSSPQSLGNRILIGK